MPNTALAENKKEIREAAWRSERWNKKRLQRNI
jgi:hypothetical protein